MATLATIQPTRIHANTLNVIRKETQYEFLKLWRAKTFSLAIIGFPVMFYALFGIANRGNYDGAADVTKYMLAGYACMGVISAALFGVGVGLSNERTQGWLELKRASPMPGIAYLVAKLVTAQVFGLLVMAILIAIGVAFGGVHLSPAELLGMIGMALAGSIPFAAMGLLVALLVPPAAAPGVVNLVYLPMSFMGGLWIPIHFLPKWIQTIAPSMPTYHLAQLMLTVFNYQSKTSVSLYHWMGLAGFTCMMVGISWVLFQKSEQNA
jgi:ABC-2 type transport system permease protein